MISFSKSTFFLTEYIVAFNGYYSAVERANYIKAALKPCTSSGWRIVDRKNLAADYPSDFDVLRFNLQEELEKDSLAALRRSPLIKRVTPQRQVFRSLKYLNETAEYDLKEFPRFTGRSSLALV